jgi:hypothetical protein
MGKPQNPQIQIKDRLANAKANVLESKARLNNSKAAAIWVAILVTVIRTSDSKEPQRSDNFFEAFALSLITKVCSSFQSSPNLPDP